MLSILTLIAGLLVLVFAGDYLVRGAVALAEKLSIDPLIIGLTIVAFGTSCAGIVRLAAGGLRRRFRDRDRQCGRIEHRQRAARVLARPALLMTINCRENGLGTSLAVMIGMSVALMAMMCFGPLSRLDGAILLALIAVCILAGRSGRPEKAAGQRS
jgi:cation:H+ antiporter